MPFMLLCHHAGRGSRAGIRENFLLGRALGMNREQLLDAICLSTLFSGAETLDVVNDAIGELLMETS
jgi:hypothetical protein